MVASQIDLLLTDQNRTHSFYDYDYDYEFGLMNMKTFLHVGCGPNTKANTTNKFSSDSWNEIRYDIDPSVSPDVIGSMLQMDKVDSGSVDAIFSSHNIEHLYPHQVPVALNEFKRVLKPEGFLVITCPDLQSVAALIADDKLTDVAYESQAGPIAPIDMVYGYRPSLEHGNEYMAHKCGFTMRVLVGTIQNSGFKSVAHLRRAAPKFDLWAVASLQELQEDALLALANGHLPATTNQA